MRWFGFTLLTAFAACASPPEKPIDALVVGHGGMGASHDQPMNSLSSIRSLCQLSHRTQGAVHGVEMDVQLTKDNALVLYHDRYLEIDGADQLINSLYLQDIPQKSDQGVVLVPTLESVLKDPLCQNLTFFLDVKLNHHGGEWTAYQHDLADALTKLLGNLKLEHQVVIECGDPQFLYAINERSGITRTFFYADDLDAFTRFMEERSGANGEDHPAQHIDGITVHSSVADLALVKRAQDDGLEIAVFSCDGVRGNSACALLNADYIETEDPEMVSGWR